MPVDVIMPKVDMDMANGILSQWHASEGDLVKQGEPLFDIETDKSTMEVEAPATGLLQQVMASSGEKIDIGVCIARIYEQGEESVVSDDVVHDDVQLPSSLDASLHAPSPEPGNDNDVASAMGAATCTHVVSLPDDADENPDKVRATPLARRLAREHGVSLSDVTGSGPRGRITKRDVSSAVDSSPPAQAATSSTSASRTLLDSLGIAYTTLPLQRMRSTIARRLAESKSTVPHFYLECDCPVDKLRQYRQEMNNFLGEHASTRITVNDFIVTAAARALEAVPEANVSWADSEIVQYHDANVSVAVSIDGGLMTPVLRAAQTKNVKTISCELADLGTRARLGKLARREYLGGSMSVTNLGMYGVQRFQAIINPPESMILAVGAIRREVVVGENDQPTVASVMTVCLSCDHRVLDGVVAARWLQSFQGFIERPIGLMI